MSKNINVGGANITIPAFPKKPTKMGIVNYIKNFFKENKKLKEKYKADVDKYNKQINEAAEKIKESPDLVSKVGGGTGKGSGIGSKVKVGAGIAAGAGAVKLGTDVGKEMEEARNRVNMNKGGIVAPKMGGKPSFKTKKSSKSIAKKYFKGTFQLVELTKAVKHILNKIDSEIESRKNAFADGKIIKENFEKSVGQVRGLVLAKEIVRETAKNIEELDD